MCTLYLPIDHRRWLRLFAFQCGPAEYEVMASIIISMAVLDLVNEWSGLLIDLYCIMPRPASVNEWYVQYGRSMGERLHSNDLIHIKCG